MFFFFFLKIKSFGFFFFSVCCCLCVCVNYYYLKKVLSMRNQNWKTTKQKKTNFRLLPSACFDWNKNHKNPYENASGKVIESIVNANCLYMCVCVNGCLCVVRNESVVALDTPILYTCPVQFGTVTCICIVLWRFCIESRD